MRRIATLLLTLIPLALCAQDDAVEPENLDATPRFVFEGDVDYVDPVLRADIGPPRVLSGTMKLGNVSIGGGLSDAEFTLDRNYVISDQGFLASELLREGPHTILFNGDEKEKDDKIIFRIPFDSEGLKCGYQAALLIIELFDGDGDMISEDQVVRTVPSFEEATFALFYVNPETGEEAKATGTITMFANLDADVTAEEDYQQLEALILELDTLLEAKQAEAAELQKLLDTQAAELKRRDAIIAEFQANQKKLIAENEQLRSGEEFKRMQESNAELRAQLANTQGAREFSAASVAQMSVRQQMLAEDNAELAESNAALRKQLADTLAEVSNLRGRQELLTRQGEKQFEYDLPPLPETAEAKQQNLPLASVSNSKAASTTASRETPPPPPAQMTLQEMALAAAQQADADSSDEPGEAATARQDKIPPGQVSDDLKPTAVVNPDEAKGTWSFALPMVAATPNESAAAAPAPKAEPAREEESSSRIERRGPRR
ncbi:hypothetical protein [Cerasicoccus maritimus]|uniref:hypothetical protein n=1 Tax=Cerasicoccus maritimus TaxID=490089 RepID=UPI0028528317|nr:hypothetical protein [Cerasicoccus maritimus]